MKTARKTTAAAEDNGTGTGRIHNLDGRRLVDAGDHLVAPSGTAIGKVGRYGWTLVDEPGAFEWLAKDRLLIDDSYQRHQAEAKILAIARRWSWVACGSLIVALRPCGGLYVMDGGHRLLAARRRDDIRELPCMIYAAESLPVEARGFLDTNTLRRPVPATDKFKALVMAGDPAAIHVRDLLAAAGLVARPSGEVAGTIRCLGVCLKLCRDNREVFDRCWPLCLEVAGSEPVSERVLATANYIEARLEGGVTLLRQPWRGRLVRLGVQGVADAAAKAAAMYSRGGPGVWSRGVVAALNVGVRNRLPVKGMGDE